MSRTFGNLRELKYDPTSFVGGDGNLAELPKFEPLFYGGGISASLLGATNHGSLESNIAHRVENMKRFDNILNGGGDDVTYTTVAGADGKPIMQPIQDPTSGEMMYPNERGQIRTLNGGKLELMRELYDSIEDKTDKIMEYCVISDEMARFVLGFSAASWDNTCAKGGNFEGKMSQEMADIDCHIIYIQSLPTGPLSQTMCYQNYDSLLKEVSEM